MRFHEPKQGPFFTAFVITKLLRMDYRTLQTAYNWIESNLSALNQSYQQLPPMQAQNLPFVLYCLAMYFKHAQLSSYTG